MSEITKIRVGDKTYDISDGAAITAITLNGDAVPVEDGVAKLTVSGGGGDSRIVTGMIAAEGGTVTLTGGLVFVVIDNMLGGYSGSGTSSTGIYVCTNDYVDTVQVGDGITVIASGHDYTIRNAGMEDFLYIAIINEQTE